VNAPLVSVVPEYEKFWFTAIAHTDEGAKSLYNLFEQRINTQYGKE